MSIRLLTALPGWGEGWFEAILLPALGILLGWSADPGDPLLLSQPFPWMLLIPLLIALRYELLPALLSILILGSTFLWHPYPEIRGLEIVAGTILVALIASEYAGYWARREAGRFLQEEITATRFRQLSDDLYVTRISLDRLEQSLIYQPISVRSTLLEIKHRLTTRRGELDTELMHDTLYFLSQLVGIQVASGYRLETGSSIPILLSAFGQAQAWQAEDPVLRKALESGVSQSLADLEITKIRHYIAVHVHTDHSGIRYLLTIEDMSFFSISKESLQIIEVIFQYLCNYAESLAKATSLLQQWPDCPAEFATDFMQLQKLAQRVPRVGMIAVYQFQSGTAAERILEHLQRLRRGLDVVWIHPRDDLIQLVILLPFAGDMAVKGHFQRMYSECHQHYAEEWAQSFVRHDFYPLGTQHCAQQFRHFMDQRAA